MREAMATLELRVTLIMQELETLRDFISNFSEEAGLDEDKVARLNLAVVESVTNVSRHAKGVGEEATVKVELNADVDWLFCVISYAGEEYSPPEPVDEISMDDFPEGGFGNFIIFNACDEVHFEYAEGRNITRMGMKLGPED
jgi:anti-sigma regulatory factor (Ser/Thr protein kinase)